MMFDRFVGWVRRRVFGGDAAPRPSAPAGKAPMHFISDGARVPRCGVGVFTRWTVILDDATCEECKKLGERARLRRRLSVR